MQLPAIASPSRLWRVAQEAEATGAWSCYLTPQENALLRAALDRSQDTWLRFLAGKVPCMLRFPKTDDEEGGLVSVDAVALAFKVRYMLYERQIDLFTSGPVKLGSEADLPEPPQIAGKNGGAAGAKSSSADDDYDMDDDEEAKPEPTCLIVDTRHEEGEPASGAQQGVIEHCLQMYDTFDNDVMQVQRFRKLQRSDVEAEEPTPARQEGEQASPATSSLSTFAKSAQFGSANLCLKHLLTTIDANREQLHVTDVELRNLISDVRKNRSKWASMERVGQEELYEACEHVVQELRGYTEHSTAFLNKVSKREAPNYYDVIKNPMDLSSVMRKLRGLQYNSKAEFVADLNLIWSNCLTYNSDPSHFLRKHAIAMRQKTLALAPLIPDIVIRSRAEVEAEAEAEERARASKRKASEGGKRSAKRRGVAEEAQPETEKDENNVQKEREEEQQEQQQQEQHQEQPEQQEQHQEQEKPQEKLQEGETKQDAEKDDDEEGSVSDGEELVEEYVPEDVESRVWNSVSRNQRYACITQRSQLFDNNKLRMDAVASVRTPASMRRFLLALIGKDPGAQFSGRGLLSSIADEGPFLLEYHVESGVPPAPPSAISAVQNQPAPRMADLPPSRYLATGLLNKLLMQNLNEMQRIRQLCNKILYIRDLQGGQVTLDFNLLPSDGVLPIDNVSPAAPQSYRSGEIRKIKDPEEDISSRLPFAAKMNRKAAHSALRRVVAKLSMAAGFEAAQPSTIDCFADVCGDYLFKLGQLLVSQLEAPNSTASFAHILKGTLEGMGVEKLGYLANYVGDDVLRQGRRLATFRSRLNTSLVEILKPEIERYQDEQFADNSEQFVLGQFSSELGDDYFGFRELGLDKELGTNLSIPFHLLQQRIADNRAGIARHLKLRVFELPVPEYPPLTTDDLPSLPAYLRQSFASILAAGGDDATRAKVPASGKLVVRKRRFDRAFKLPAAKDELSTTADSAAPEGSNGDGLGPESLGPDSLGPDSLGPDSLGAPDSLAPDSLGAPASSSDPNVSEVVAATSGALDPVTDLSMEQGSPGMSQGESDNEEFVFTFDELPSTGSLLMHGS